MLRRDTLVELTTPERIADVGYHAGSHDALALVRRSHAPDRQRARARHRVAVRAGCSDGLAPPRARLRHRATDQWPAPHRQRQLGSDVRAGGRALVFPVSYTHLTLPTSDLV